MEHFSVENRPVKLNIPGSGRYNTVVIPSPGDGSCFLHSVLMAFYIPYRTEQYQGRYCSRSKIVKEFRKERLVDSLLATDDHDPERRPYYQTIGNGTIADLGRHDPFYSLEGLQKFLKSDDHMGDESYSLVQAVVRRAIYIIDGKSGDIYPLGQVPPSDLDSICLYYFPGHYETLGLMENDGDIVTHFKPTHSFIKLLKQRSQQASSEASSL